MIVCSKTIKNYWSKKKRNTKSAWKGHKFRNRNNKTIGNNSIRLKFVANLNKSGFREMATRKSCLMSKTKKKNWCQNFIKTK